MIIALGWNIVFQKMRQFVYVVIYINRRLEKNQVEIVLPLMDLQIGKRKRDLILMLENINSAHNLAWKKCQDLMNQEQHIEVAFETHSTQTRKEYRMRLTTTIDCIRFLLHQGLACLLYTSPSPRDS